MKGPGGRLRFDLRRVWECPACHRRDWTSGDIVYRLCTCSAKTEPPRQVWMKLIEVDPLPSAAPPRPVPATEQVAAPAQSKELSGERLPVVGPDHATATAEQQAPAANAAAPAIPGSAPSLRDS